MSPKPLPPEEYRLERFVSLGFNLAQANVLAVSRDANNVHIYWGDAEKLLKSGCSHRRVFSLLRSSIHELPKAALVYEDDKSDPRSPHA